MTLRLIVAAAAVLVFTSVAQGTEVRLLASGALKEAYLELLASFEKASGHTVSAAWSNTTDIRKRVAEGEAADLVILGNDGAEALLQAGKLVANTRTGFATSRIYVAVRAGAPRPDIGSGDALKRALIAAKSVAYSSGASGTYIVAMLKRLGIYDEISAKASVTKANEPVGDKVARGEAEIGFHQLSELIPVPGIDIVGPLPDEVQQVTLFSGALHSGTKQPEAATALAGFLVSPAAAESIRKYGLEPAPPN